MAKSITLTDEKARALYGQTSDAALRGLLEENFDKRTLTPDVTERIRSWEDVLAAHGTTQAKFDASCVGLTSDEVGYRMCKMVAAALNEGWTPDWSNANEVKYWPWMEYQKGSGFRFVSCVGGRLRSAVGSRLCFKSSALAIHYGEHFADIITKFFL